MSVELLPCPFCGGKVSLTEVSFCLELMQFECADCGTRFFMKDDIWNQRVYPPEVEKAIERMKPKRPLNYKVCTSKQYFGTCPNCDEIVSQDDDFCLCGQRLDWREE